MKKKIWIKVKYDNYYKLINKVRDLVSIYEIKKEKDWLFLKLNYEDYEKLCKYIVSYDFLIVENTGIYYFLNLINNNKLFVITSFIGILLFFLFNNVMVEVEILHENENIRELLYEELENYGISVLSFKKSYDEITLIKEEILNKYEEDLDWLEIEVTGMKYTVRVEERIITNIEEEEDYCNVYATKSGVITSISVESGVAMVKIGDYIEVGDLLISGDIIYNEEIKSEVCASGVVKAEKWYEANVIIPFSYFETEETGVNRYNLVFENSSEEEYRIFYDRVEEYISDKTLLFDLFGYKLYLENQIEVTRVYKNYTEQEALEQAFLLSYENMLLKLSEKDEIIDQNVLKKVVNDSTIEVDIFIITEEVIN